MKYVDEELRDIRSAIRAGCAYTGVTQYELAGFMGIDKATLNRKLNAKGRRFTDEELAIAQEMVRYRDFLKGEGNARTKYKGDRLRNPASSAHGRVCFVGDGAGQ